MAIRQFAKAEELSPELFDRPYFVVPKDEVQAKALSIMRKALTQTNTLGIGEIALRPAATVQSPPIKNRIPY
jgi:DNA end-binding protein Ku